MKKTKSLIYINIKPFFSFKLLFYFTFIIFGKSFAQTWQSIGPFGGDRHFVYQDPHNHNTFYTGGIGFVHRTTDDGENWFSLTDDPRLGETGVEAVIVNYSDSNKILTNSNLGMILSIDRGQTWSLSDTGLSSEKKATTFVSFLSNPNYVFAGIGVKDSAQISQGGVYFSDNFGQTWQSMNTGLSLTKTTRIYSSNTDDLYAATLGAGLFKFDTTSQSWSAIGSFDDSVTSIKVDPTNDSILIAGTYSHWLFRSQDKGTTWVQLAKPSQLNSGQIPAVCWDIEFDPQNTNVIYTRLYSGQEIPWYNDKDALLKTKGTFFTTDGGNTWVKLNSIGSFTDMLVDGYSPLISDNLPVRSSRIIRTGGGAGNIKISNDGGSSFQIKNKGIATVLVNRVSVDKYGRVFVGAEAGAALLRNIQGLQSQWQFLNISPNSERNGYNWQMVVAPEDSSLVFFCKGEFSHFSNVGKGIYKYNLDSNVNGSVLPSTKYAGFMYITTGNTSDTLYAGSHSSGVWMSVDKGNNWTKFKNGIENKMVQTFYVSRITRLPLYSAIRQDSIRWRKSFPGETGGFYKWNGNVWELKDNGLGTPPVSDMKVSPFDENKIYLTTFKNGLYKSTDGGNSWTHISKTPEMSISTVVEINPNDDNNIFVGTRNNGVWESTNGGSSWSNLNFSGLKSFTINDITISLNGDLFAAESGGSVQYIPGLITAIKDSKISIPNNFELEQNYPNPFNPSTVIKYFIPVKRRGSSLYNVILKVYDVLGKEVVTLVNEKKPAGSYQINFNAQILSSGIYFYRLSAISKTTNFVQTKKMILLR